MDQKKKPVKKTGLKKRAAAKGLDQRTVLNDPTAKQLDRLYRNIATGRWR
jgi:hypothetical protein